MDSRRVPHLTRRGKIFYFRIAVPRRDALLAVQPFEHNADFLLRRIPLRVLRRLISASSSSCSVLKIEGIFEIIFCPPGLSPLTGSKRKNRETFRLGPRWKGERDIWIPEAASLGSLYVTKPANNLSHEQHDVL